uniref:beta strand repeat-containing protein n=1 Tax=Rhodanobacter sp. L36 TaxID=1747221 RepID=UPI00131E32A5
MNATNGRPNKTHRIPTLTIAPVTQAIRTALAISVTLLALSVSGQAIAAGTCVATTSTTISCNGDFTETLSDLEFLPVTDLTLVVGDVAPSSVTPAIGLIGIDASWRGTVGVTSFADITTEGASGIHAYGSTSANVTNDGSINTKVTVPGAEGMDINAYGDVTIINDGPITAYGTGAYDVTTVNAYSINGKASIDNQYSGVINATAQDGNAIALTANGGSAANATNEGVIIANSVNGNAVGAIAEAYVGDANVTNSGRIDATSTNSQAVGILVSSNIGNSTIINFGQISAASGQDSAIGIEANSALGTTISNSGSISANSTSGSAFAVSASTNNGTSSVSNSGAIQANSAYGNAYGIWAHATSGGTVVNDSGAISATSIYAQAVGVLASSDAGHATADNDYSTIYAHSSSLAIGIEATSGGAGSLDNASTVDNHYGSIVAKSTGGAVVGVLAQTTDGIVTVTNSGSIIGKLTGAGGEYGISASATGILARSFDGNATVLNNGYIHAISTVEADVGGHPNYSAYSPSTGILARTYDGNATVSNLGTINVVADSHDKATGIDVDALDGNAYVSNIGSMGIGGNIAVVSGVGQVAGIKAYAQYGEVTVLNSGNINTRSVYGYNASKYSNNRDRADGIIASGGYGSITNITNSGSIKATGSWWATGIEASDYEGSVSLTNTLSGAITVTGDQHAIGIGAAQKWYGSVGVASGIDLITQTATFDNAGSINVVATGNCGNCNAGVYAVGMEAFLDYGFGGITITNSGTLNVETKEPLVSTGGSFGRALGILAVDYGPITISNSGSIAVTTAGYAPALGIDVSSVNGNVSVSNAGNISSTATQVIHNSISGTTLQPDRATGIYAATGSPGSDPAYSNTHNLDVINKGGVAVGADYAFGINARTISYVGDIAVVNAGYVSVDGGTGGYGILAHSQSPIPAIESNNFVLQNTGDITVKAAHMAQGITAFDVGNGNDSITNAGDIFVVGQLTAIGVSGVGQYANLGVLSLNNIGSIDARVANALHSNSVNNYYNLSSHAVALHSIGAIDVSNSGSISAQLYAGTNATNYGAAFGVLVQLQGTGAASITNTGVISATSRFSAHNGAFGFYGITMGIVAESFLSYGDVSIVNTGSVTANALSGYYAANGATAANGIGVVTYGGLGRDASHLGDVSVTNVTGGSITATAVASLGAGYAIANGISAHVYNLGTTSPANQFSAIRINNAGGVSAIASFDPSSQGSATANGILAANGAVIGSVYVRNTGTIYATATSPGVAIATGISTTAHDITVALTKDSLITATANSVNSIATGVFASGATLAAGNSGTIKAISTGTNGMAYGVNLVTPGDLSFTNTATGAIHANASHAVTVDLTSGTTATLINNGLIVARPTVVHTNGIAVETNAPNAVIQNY